jgi:hypothetical protein
MLPLILIFALLASSANAVKIIISPGHTECITQAVTEEHFTAPGGPRIDGKLLISGYSEHLKPHLAVQVFAPDHRVLWVNARVQDDVAFSADATGQGDYRLCFHNPWITRMDAVVDLVYFTLTHLRQPARVNVPHGHANERNKLVAHQDHIEELQTSVLWIGELVDVVKGSQVFLQRKLERHKITVASSSARAFFYTLLEMAAISGMAGAQVYLLQRLFKDNKSLRFAV